MGDTADGGGMSDREEGLAWQVGVWDRISQIYWSEIERRFEPVVDAVLARADLQAGERVLDVGTGTGAVAERQRWRSGPAATFSPSTSVLRCSRSRGDGRIRRPLGSK